MHISATDMLDTSLIQHFKYHIALIHLFSAFHYH